MPCGLRCPYVKISGRAPLWSPAEDGLILWRRLGINESDIVKIDFCGQVLQTLPPSDSGLTLQMAFNAARTRLYNVSLIDPPAKLRWLAYPDGGAWNLLAEREFIFGAAVDPSDKFALYVDFDGGHRIDFAAPAVTVDLAIDPSPSEFALSPDGLFAAYADDSDALVIWDLTTDVKTPAVVDAHFNGYPLKWVGKRVYYIAQLVSPKFQTLLRAYNTETNAIEELREVDSFVRDFAVSDDHAWVSVTLEEELRILAL